LPRNKKAGEIFPAFLFLGNHYCYIHSKKVMSIITFTSIPKERVWGGRTLESDYGRILPKADVPYGESWELVDRDEAQSIVISDFHKGKSLHELWRDYREEIFGVGLPDSERFPLLIKILDAKSDLSVQVHPSDRSNIIGNSEPKTEMWYVASAVFGAKFYVGLRQGCDRASFEKALHDGSVESQLHTIIPKIGESILIPSGRLHAIGAGLVIFEIQQNSDTTYRVFDWNRSGLDGKMRDLHVEESLANIDFSDIEPNMDIPQENIISACEYFTVEKFFLEKGELIKVKNPNKFSLLHIIEGSLECEGKMIYSKGNTLLVSPGNDQLFAAQSSIVLRTSIVKLQ
jgi:mannose-6-phosphate isomerase